MKKTALFSLSIMFLCAVLVGCNHTLSFRSINTEATKSVSDDDILITPLVLEETKEEANADSNEEEQQPSEESEFTVIGTVKDDHPELPVFEKHEDNGKMYIESRSLNGSYTLSNQIGLLKFTIRLIDSDAYFILHEDGENKALSSINSLDETYTFQILAGTDVFMYNVQISKDENSIYNTFVVKGLEYMFADYSQLFFTIGNDSGAYILGEIDTSDISDFFYEENYYAQALTCFNNKEYLQALTLLDTFNTEDESTGTYVSKKVEELRTQIKGRAYREAFNLHINGNSKDALKLLELCDSKKKDVYKLILECSKEVGKHCLGEVIKFGIKGTEWIIIDMEQLANSKYKVLLISKDTIENHSYDSYLGEWKSCDLRSYLNSKEFLDTYFTKAQQNQLIDIERNDYTDKVTTLDENEVEKYLILDEQRCASNIWWLRSVSFYRSYVYTNGDIETFSPYTPEYVARLNKPTREFTDKLGIRPVIMTIID